MMTNRQNMENEKQVNSIKAVIFDYGGVLAEEGFRDGLRAIALRNGLDPDWLHQIGLDAVYDSGYMVNRGTEADFLRLLRSRAHIRESDAELVREVMGRFVLRPWMIDLVRNLRREGMLTAILSDQTDWLDRLDARDHFYREFDKVYVSYHIGKGKRDPSVFDDVVSDMGIAHGQALFVDDNPGNVERARDKGLKTILFEDREQFMREMGEYFPN
ncbi:MAG: HAD family phosphatase [Nitrospirota bacterium]|nr:HAD family phosphatase [Nitrospirota bacterium]